MNARIEKTTIIQPSLIPGGTKTIQAFAVIKADGTLYCYAKTEEEAKQALNFISRIASLCALYESVAQLSVQHEPQTIIIDHLNEQFRRALDTLSERGLLS